MHVCFIDSRYWFYFYSFSACSALYMYILSKHFDEKKNFFFVTYVFMKQVAGMRKKTRMRKKNTQNNAHGYAN